MKFVILITFALSVINLFSLEDVQNPYHNPQMFPDKNARNFELEEYQYQYWENDAWQDSLQYSYSYYPDSTTIVYRRFQNNNWFVDGKLTYVYETDAHDLLLLTIWQEWNNGWKNSYKYSYFYNDQQELVSTVYQEWTNENWLATYLGTYNYDENSNCISELWQYWQDETTLINAYLFSYSYDENDNLISLLYQNYNESGDLINSYRKNYTYANSLMIEFLYQIWQNNDWQNSYKYTYDYDEYGILINSYYYEWQRVWQENLFSVLVYDENGNLTEELWQYEQGTVNYNYAHELYSYIETNAEDTNISQISTVCFPNPFRTFTTISFNISRKDAKNAKMNIYNLKGQKVKQLKIMNYELGNNKIIWDGTDNFGRQVNSGIYLYKIRIGKETVVRKIVKEK